MSLSESYQKRLPSLEDIRKERERRSTERAYVEIARNSETIRDRCKSLAGFVREAWHVLEPGTPYVHGWHIDFICAHLEAITLGKFLRLGIDNRVQFNVPPGTMKSTLVSVMWQAWEWGPCEMPWMQYVSTSFSDDNVRRDTRKTRDLVSSAWYQQLWGHLVRLTRMGESSFANDAKGSREGRAFRSLTGIRGHRLVIDDPHSTETAESPAERATTIRVFRESVPQRINDAKSSAIVNIMQRLHQGDCSGVARELKLGYVEVILPMEFEPERRCVSPLGIEDPRTEEGELLFPERFPRETVERDKNAMGAYAVAGQLQQRPSPRGGLMFNRGWFEVVRAAPASVRWVRAYDLAATEKKTKDTTTGPAFTAGVKMGRDGAGIFYIGHVFRTRESGAGVRATIKNTATADGPTVQIDLPQDPGQAGKVQAQDMIAMLAGYNVHASPETGDKETRAEPFAAQAEAGNVKLVEGPWNAAYLDELELFPAGKYKDQVDASSRAFARLVRQKVVIAGPVVITGGPRNIPGQ